MYLTSSNQKTGHGLVGISISQTAECGQMVCRDKVSNVDQLKEVLIGRWDRLSHDTLNRAIDELPERLKYGY